MDKNKAVIRTTNMTLDEELSNKIKESLKEGISIEIPGVGVLRPHFRMVNNAMGRNYSLTVTLDHNKDFKKQLGISFRKQPSWFEQYMSEENKKKIKL